MSGSSQQRQRTTYLEVRGRVVLEITLIVGAGTGRARHDLLVPAAGTVSKGRRGKKKLHEGKKSPARARGALRHDGTATHARATPVERIRTPRRVVGALDEQLFFDRWLRALPPLELRRCTASPSCAPHQRASRRRASALAASRARLAGKKAARKKKHSMASRRPLPSRHAIAT